MLAEIYSFPGTPEPVPVLIEAAVTDATCGREMLGEAADRRSRRRSACRTFRSPCRAVMPSATILC